MPLPLLLDLKREPARLAWRTACTKHTDVAGTGSALAKPVMGLFEPLVRVGPGSVWGRAARGPARGHTACSIDLSAPTRAPPDISGRHKYLWHLHDAASAIRRCRRR
jgi:hypothetical protein